MARISLRELFRFRSIIFAPPAKLCNFPSFPFCSCSFPKRFVLDAGSTPSYGESFVLLKSCQSLSQIVQIHARLITCGLFYYAFWANRVLLQASDCGDIGYTLSIFRCISAPNTFCVNRVIKAYSISTLPHKAVKFYFEWLKIGFSPDSFTFLSLFGACAKESRVKLCWECHAQAVKRGLISVLPVQNCLVNAYSCCGYGDLARKVFDEIAEPDLVSWNTIIDVLVRYGDLDTAHKVFDEMPERNVVTWNSMMGGYLNCRNPGNSLKIFREMAQKGLRGSYTTMVIILTACSRSARLNEGRSVHGSVLRNFSKSNILVDAALIDMYGRCRRAEVARRVFDQRVDKNLVCWNAMIMGHCLHGNPRDGLGLFEEMIAPSISGIENKVEESKARGDILPDEITMIGVLCACARAGLLTDATNYFNQMADVFFLKPSFAHFWCMANVYVSAGLVQEAEEILRKSLKDEIMSVESLAWADLLVSTRFHGDVFVGEQMVKSLIAKQPRNPFFYQLLMNIYAVAGRWEDLTRFRESIKEKRVGRVPGCGLVDLNEIVHDFPVQNPGKTPESETNLDLNYNDRRLAGSKLWKLG